MTDDRLLLKRFLHNVLVRNRKLSPAFYDELRKQDYPIAIKKGIQWYFNNYGVIKSGGQPNEPSPSPFRNVYIPLDPLNANGRKPQSRNQASSSSPSINLDEFKLTELGKGACGVVLKGSSEDLISLLSQIPQKPEELSRYSSEASPSTDPNSLAIKFLTLSIESDDHKKYFEQHLTALFQLFSRQSHLQIYRDIIINTSHQITIQRESQSFPLTVAYTMQLLSPLSDFTYHPKLYALILEIAFQKIEQIHNVGIIHCDLKIDNLLYDPTSLKPEDKRQIASICDYLSKNMYITDFDGCILLKETRAESLKQAIEQCDFHMITPVYAHPYMIYFLYSELLNKIHSENQIQQRTTTFQDSIEFYRSRILLENRYDYLNHREYQDSIFGANRFNDVFRIVNEINCENANAIIQRLQFADYYAMTMSFLVAYFAYLRKPEFIKESAKPYININYIFNHAIELLKRKAEQLLQIPHPVILSQQTGGITTPSPKTSKFPWQTPITHPILEEDFIIKEYYNKTLVERTPNFFQNMNECDDYIDEDISEKELAFFGFWKGKKV